MRNALALKDDVAAAAAEKSRNGVERRRLARAVRADKRYDLALVDLEGDALDGVDRAVIH